MRRTNALALPAALAALALAACSSTPDAPTESGAAGEPIVIEHAFGETEVPAGVERVATVGASTEDALLALDVVPVIMPRIVWGSEESGMYRWTEERIDELGAEPPALWDETDGIDFEAINAAEPELILAPYSGITQEDYETLSSIAPTVAFPESAWATPWRDTIRITGEALGRSDDADALLADLDQQIADAAAAHPELEGKTSMFTFITAADLGTIGYYAPDDARQAFLEELGLETAPSVVELSETVDGFYGQVSAEQADTFADVDMLFAYGDDALLTAMQADPLLSTIPAIARGSVVLLPDATPQAAAVSPPTALSLPWALDDYAAQIAEAAAKIG